MAWVTEAVVFIHQVRCSFSQWAASVLLFLEEQACNNLWLGSYWPLNSVTSRGCCECACACKRERVWMRACVYVPASCPHTPSSLVLQQADCCLGNTTSSCLLKVAKNAALFIYLSNFFSSFLSEGQAYAPLSSGGRYWNDFRCDKIRTLLIDFSLCILRIQQLKLLFKTCTSFPYKQHCGWLYENKNL